MNRDYGKLVSGNLRYPKNKEEWIDEHGELHSVNNPNSEKLLELGYLPITYTDPPADAPDEQHYESSWKETETEIVQTWYLVEDPVYPEPEPTMSDLVEAVERGLTT